HIVAPDSGARQNPPIDLLTGTRPTRASPRVPERAERIAENRADPVAGNDEVPTIPPAESGSIPLAHAGARVVEVPTATHVEQVAPTRNVSHEQLAGSASRSGMSERAAHVAKKPTAVRTDLVPPMRDVLREQAAALTRNVSPVPPARSVSLAPGRPVRAASRSRPRGPESAEQAVRPVQSPASRAELTAAKRIAVAMPSAGYGSFAPERGARMPAGNPTRTYAEVVAPPRGRSRERVAAPASPADEEDKKSMAVNLGDRRPQAQAVDLDGGYYNNPRRDERQ
ncbi:hypothetical protein GGF32_009850, partial [Allomyces javanicus]